MHKMCIHILSHNMPIWEIIVVGLQAEFFQGGLVPGHEATPNELKIIQDNTQACGILFNSLCPQEFKKISRLQSAKEIWDTLIEMHEGTVPMKESSLGILQGQLNKFKKRDGERVTDMYSRLVLITNEIASSNSEELIDRFIIRNVLRAFESKYDTVCTLIQMIPITNISSLPKS